jgi:hypothetical protein
MSRSNNITLDKSGQIPHGQYQEERSDASMQEGVTQGGEQVKFTLEIISQAQMPETRNHKPK